MGKDNAFPESTPPANDGFSFQSFGGDEGQAFSFDESSRELDNSIREKEFSIFELVRNGAGEITITGLKDKKNTYIVKVPVGVTGIAAGAFEDSNIVTAELPEGLLVIEEGAFRNCRLLTSINIPSTVKFINAQAFYGDVNLKVTVPKTVLSVGAQCVEGTLGEIEKSEVSAILQKAEAAAEEIRQKARAEAGSITKAASDEAEKIRKTAQTGAAAAAAEAERRAKLIVHEATRSKEESAKVLQSAKEKEQSAQNSSEQIREQSRRLVEDARKQANSIVADAEAKAKQIVAAAQGKEKEITERCSGKVTDYDNTLKEAHAKANAITAEAKKEAEKIVAAAQGKEREIAAQYQNKQADYDNTLKEAHAKANAITAEARKEAEKIVAAAQGKEREIAAQYKNKQADYDSVISKARSEAREITAEAKREAESIVSGASNTADRIERARRRKVELREKVFGIFTVICALVYVALFVFCTVTFSKATDMAGYQNGKTLKYISWGCGAFATLLAILVVKKYRNGSAFQTIGYFIPVIVLVTALCGIGNLKVTNVYFDVENGGSVYVEKDSTYQLKKLGKGENLVFYPEINGTTVDKISDYTTNSTRTITFAGGDWTLKRGNFSHANNLKTITFENANVTAVRKTFKNCGQLKDLYLNNSTLTASMENKIFGDSGKRIHLNGSKVSGIQDNLELLEFSGASGYERLDGTNTAPADIKTAVIRDADAVQFGKFLNDVRRVFKDVHRYYPIGNRIYISASVSSLPDYLFGDEWDNENAQIEVYFEGTAEQWANVAVSSTGNGNYYNGNVTVFYDQPYTGNP